MGKRKTARRNCCAEFLFEKRVGGPAVGVGTFMIGQLIREAFAWIASLIWECAG